MKNVWKLSALQKTALQIVFQEYVDECLLL